MVLVLGEFKLAVSFTLPSKLDISSYVGRSYEVYEIGSVRCFIPCRVTVKGTIDEHKASIYTFKPPLSSTSMYARTHNVCMYLCTYYIVIRPCT